MSIKHFFLKKLLKYIRNTLIGIILFIILTLFLLNLSPVQNFLSNIAEKYLTEKLGTTVSIDYIDIRFPNTFVLNGVFVESRERDTILSVRALKGKISNLISFDEKVVINYVGLEGGYFNLIRDSNEVWNFQFILDAFKSQPKEKDSKELVINIEDVNFKDIRLNMIDKWHGSDLLISFSQFKVDNNSINSSNKIIDVGSVIVDGLDFVVVKYESTYPAGSFLREIDNDPFNPESWNVNVNSFKVTNARFRTENQLFPVLYGQFDGSYIDIRDINIDVEQVYIVNDSIFGHVNNLVAVEKSGIEIRTMRGDVKVSPRISEVKNLHLKTNKSTFNHYFAMEYPRFPAFLDFIHEVTLVADVRNSTIAIEDIGYFAPNMNRWQGEVYNGEFRGRGTVDKLDVQYFNLNDGVTSMKGAFSIHGIPDMPNTTMTLEDGDIQTTYAELIQLFPQIKELDIQQFEKLGNIVFKGNMSGYYNNLTFDALLNTSVGNVRMNSLNIDFSTPDIFKYQGNISADNIALHEILNNPDFGPAGFKGEISGNGFDYKKNNIHVDGVVGPFHFKGYSYEEFDVDAKIADGILNSRLAANDPNARLDLNVDIDFKELSPIYVYKTNIDFLDLYVLNLTNDTISFSGLSEGTLSGNSFKNMEGEGVFRNFIAIRDLDTFEFSELAVHSIRNENTNYLNLKSEELNVRLSGNFYLDEVGHTFQNILSYYLPEIIEPVANHVPDQNFQFQIESNNLDKYTKLLYPELKLPEGVYISGTIKDNTNDIELNVNVPFFQYKNFNAANISIHSYGDLLGMKINAHANDVSSADKKMISELDLMSTLSKNKLDFSIATTVSNEVDRATINGYAYTVKDSIVFKIRPSEVFFNNQMWSIEGNNEIIYAKEFLHIDNFKLDSRDQSVVINAADIKTTRGINNISLTNINLQPILQMVGMEDLPVYGNINGLVSFVNLPNGLDAVFDLHTDKLKSIEHVLGQIKLKGKFNSDNNQLLLEYPSGMYDESGTITLNGTWSNIGEPDHTLDVQAKGDQVQLTWAEPFMAELTKGLKGTVSGYLNFKGPFNTPVITGRATITEGKFIPIITGVQYTLPEMTIDITSNNFTLSNSIISDDEGHTGTLSGKIEHQYFSNIDFQVRMNSGKLKVLDLNENEGENFYGKAYASANLILTGLLMDMTMNITATTLQGSKLYIPLTDNTDLNEYEFINFKKKYSSDISEPASSKKTRLNIYMDALATPDLEAVIIMDPVTDEVINAKGNGNVSMFIPSEGDMRLNGTYTIQTGYYDFILSQLRLFVYKNRFNILDGSSITWDGDLTGATVNVKGNSVKRARLYDLITDDIERMGGTILQSERNDAMLPQNIIIDMNMTGQLLSPDFKFNLSLEETRSIGTYAYQKLQRINSDDRDLLNQVVSLLVVNQFMPTSGINSNMAVNTGVSNVTEMFSTFASSQLTNFTNKVLGVEDLYVNLKYKNYNITDDITSGGLSYLNRNEAGLSVRKNFFSDRIVLDLGGVYDWGRAGMGSSGFSDNFAIDFRLNYLLTTDGRLRLNIFRNSNFDAVSFQNVGKQGVGLNYRRSFNNLYELLGIRYRPPVKAINLKMHYDERMIPVDTLIEINPYPLTKR